ncbi:MAG: polysaccharide deacetylase 2 family uncharacterized protein YibQ [Desulforhopalus sp.]|jgi:polysaccharide deacetylase 2 family uncharacterized protein YibQ
MVPRKNTTRRSKKKPVRKQWLFPSFGRLLLFLFLFLVLIFSICTAGYVIFFRTVFAQEIMPQLKNSIVFEEPDPPVPQNEDKIVLIEKKVLPVVEPIIKERKVFLPMVAVIIDDIGYNYGIGKQLLEMPLQLTFSFLPFAPYTKQLEEVAYNSGKTIFLHLPLEPQSSEFNPGPGALMLNDSSAMQIEKLQRCLDEVPHAVGVNNHMGSLYTEDKPAMERLMVELSNKDLLFVDSYTTSASVGLESAQRYGVKSARRHVFLDNELSRDHICGQLEKLVEIATEGGLGIGIAHPHEMTLNALKSCSPLHESKVQYVSILDVL